MVSMMLTQKNDDDDDDDRGGRGNDDVVTLPWPGMCVFRGVHHRAPNDTLIMRWMEVVN
jgi:hypothetical protein